MVSLLVAGINIANTMYASILERTKDIGVMKAVGAKNHLILSMFAIESGLLSLMGGILAIIVGTFISIYAGGIVSSSGYGMLTPALNAKLYVICIFFSLLVGILAGLLPAYRASKMKPVDALRYE